MSVTRSVICSLAGMGAPEFSDERISQSGQLPFVSNIIFIPYVWIETIMVMRCIKQGAYLANVQAENATLQINVALMLVRQCMQSLSVE